MDSEQPERGTITKSSSATVPSFSLSPCFISSSNSLEDESYAELDAERRRRMRSIENGIRVGIRRMDGGRVRKWSETLSYIINRNGVTSEHYFHRIKSAVMERQRVIRMRKISINVVSMRPLGRFRM